MVNLSQPSPHNKRWASQGYIVRPCLTKLKPSKQKVLEKKNGKTNRDSISGRQEHKNRIRKTNSILYSCLEACLKYIVYFEKNALYVEKQKESRLSLMTQTCNPST